MRMVVLFSVFAVFTLSCESSVTGSENEVIQSMKFVEISPGTFEMGASVDEEGSTALERPVHTVTIDYSFEIMSIEVSQGVWESVMGSNPAAGASQGENYPVYNVSWDDCQEFCNQMNIMDSAYTYRLPAESEWEFCCRATSVTAFYWGSSTNYIDNFAWCAFTAGGNPHQVQELISNQWDLFDMSGNLFEWCQDSYHFNYNGAPDDGSAWIDAQNGDRIVRGGCFESTTAACRSAFREPMDQSQGFESTGFRLVRTPN